MNMARYSVEAVVGLHSDGGWFDHYCSILNDDLNNAWRAFPRVQRGVMIDPESADNFVYDYDIRVEGLRLPEWSLNGCRFANAYRQEPDFSHINERLEILTRSIISGQIGVIHITAEALSSFPGCLLQNHAREQHIPILVIPNPEALLNLPAEAGMEAAR